MAHQPVLPEKITLKDIADDTGLSISTVSRVLRGEGKSSAKNEQMIMESAQRLGYPLQKQRTPLEFRRELYIAVVTHLYEGEFFTSFFNGFHEASKGTNVRFFLFSIANLESSVEDFLFDLQKHFDAAVIFLPKLDASDYKRIVKKLPPSFPVISTATIMNPVLDTITFDAYGGGHLVAERFHELGYTKVGLIHGPLDKPEARFRSNGFVDFIRSIKGIDIVWEFNGDYSVEKGQEAFTAYQNATIKPQAIFSANDSMLFGFLELARASGIKTPSDLAIAGYDNLPLCKLYNPQITSVKTDFTNLGLNVIRLLIDRLENPVPHQGFLSLIPVSLEIRGSA